MWTEMSNIIRGLIKEIFRESELYRLQAEESWWRSGDIGKAIKKK